MGSSEGKRWKLGSPSLPRACPRNDDFYHIAKTQCTITDVPQDTVNREKILLEKMKIPTGTATSFLLSSKNSHSCFQVEYIFLVLKVVELLVLSVEFKKTSTAMAPHSML